MSTTETEVLPAVPARRSILAAARAGSSAAQAGPFAGWRDQAQTEELPALSRVSTSAKPTGGRAVRRERDRVAARRAGRRRHLQQALTGLLIAAAILTGLQLYAAAGISSARQAALARRDARTAAARTEQATEQSAHTTTAPTEQAEQADAPAEQWVVEGTTAAAPSPLDLPRCTTSPDTPLPCLATISPSQTRAVVLEEDASLTALVRR